jgi:hypothetical protein
VVAFEDLAQVLGRVTGVHLDTPRGADVVHSVRVDPSWLERGDPVEVTLPRNLRCAECDGGGCDRCGRAGAVSLWSREEPPAVVEVTLPRRSAEDLLREPTVVLRIPDSGGLPEPSSGHARGMLLLRVTASSEPDPSVIRVAPVPSWRRSSLPTEPRSRLILAAALLLVALVLVSYLFSRR